MDYFAFMFTQFVAAVVVGQCPLPGDPDSLLPNLLAMDVGRSTQRNYLRLRRHLLCVASDRMGSHDCDKPTRPEDFEAALQQVHRLHIQQLQEFQQRSLSRLSSSSSAQETREERFNQTLSLLQDQHKKLASVLRAAADEETQVLKTLLAGLAGSSSEGGDEAELRDKTKSSQEEATGMQIFKTLQSRLHFKSVAECTAKVQTVFSRVDALTNFFRVLCDLLDIPVAGATFSKVEAAVVQLFEEARQQRALLEDQQRHLLQQHSLLLSLQPGAPSGETPRYSDTNERKNKRVQQQDTACSDLGKKGKEERRGAAAEEQDTQDWDGQTKQGLVEVLEVSSCEEKERADAAVATVTALQQLLKVDHVTLILPKLTEILSRVRRLTRNATPGMRTSISDDEEQVSSGSEEDDTEAARTPGTSPEGKGDLGASRERNCAGKSTETGSLRSGPSVSVTVATEITN